MDSLLKATVVLLVMINPTAKILVILALTEKYKKAEATKLIFKSNAVGLLLMVVFGVFGTFILSEILRIELDSLRVAGGFVLFAIGFEYLWKGELKILHQVESIEELAVAPIGTPLIAGPATITSVITLSALYGVPIVISASVSAIILNTLIMLAAVRISSLSNKLLHSVIRIIGLFIMSIGTQMMLEGLRNSFIL